MKYMTIMKSAEALNHPPAELYEAIQKLAAEAKAAGVFVDTGGLGPTSEGFRVRLAEGVMSVSDGPFTEAKEVIGGFAIFDVEGKAEVQQWAVKFMDLHRVHWPAFEGVCEVRPLFGADELGM